MRVQQSRVGLTRDEPTGMNRQPTSWNTGGARSLELHLQGNTANVNRTVFLQEGHPGYADRHLPNHPALYVDGSAHLVQGSVQRLQGPSTGSGSEGLRHCRQTLGGSLER